MKSFEPLSLPLSRHQSGGIRRPPPPPPSAMPSAASPPRLPQPRRGSRGLNGDRSTLLHLRRSELAGWRTKSVFPSQREGPNPNCFLPILKLRGLPFFCSRKHVCHWLGDLSIYLKDLIFVLEVDSLTTGFGLVTFHTPQAAYDAWQKLHKAPIVGKRFVEVFALFPPHCPLSRRADTVGSGLTSSTRAAQEALIPPVPPPNETAPVTPAPGSGLIPDPHQQCCFCGFSYWQHGDHGVAAYATLRLRRLMDSGAIAQSPGLMHTAFLKVPALLFQDAGAVSRHEVELFDPDLWHEKRGESLMNEPGVVSLDALENNSATVWSDRSSTFFDLLQVESYHMRILISEVANILVTHQNEMQQQRSDAPKFTGDRGCSVRKQPPGTLSIADIGNRLSTRARAYLFLTETKLKNVLETFEEFFILSEPIGPYSFYSVSLTPQLLSRGSMLIWNMQPYQLSRRGRRRETTRKATSGDVLSLQPLERRSTQIASNQISYGRFAITPVASTSSQSPPPLLSLSRATSCAVSRVPDTDVDANFTLSPSIRHQRLHTPPTPIVFDNLAENTPPDIFSATGVSLGGAPPPEEPLSQVLVDFIKSAGLESIMSADSTASSSRRLSQWTTAVPPGLEDVPPLCAALTPASRSRTCPGCRHDLSSNASPNVRQVASPVARSQNRPSWMIMSPQAQDRPTGMDPVIERQQLISNLLKQRDEVEARIEEALNCPTPLAAMPQSRQLNCVSQTQTKGLGTFANDLMPGDNFPLVFDPHEDDVIEPTYTDTSFDPLEDFLLNERAQPAAPRRPIGETLPAVPSLTAAHSRLTPIEVSEILRALDR